MMPEDLLEAYGYGIEQIYAKLEQEIINDVVRRIRDADGVITRTADFQLNQLLKLGYSESDIRELMVNAYKGSEDYVNRLYTLAIATDYIDNKKLYEGLGKTFIPFKDNVLLQNIVNDAKSKTISNMNNMMRSTGFVVDSSNGKRAVSLSNYMNEKLNQMYVDIHAGAFDYNTVLRKAVNEMTNSGIRWIDYESGWHNRITVAARRDVMTTLRDISRTVTESVAKDLGVDMFEVSAHGGARPEHAEWQGEVYNSHDLEAVCGLGDMLGLHGINCYHDYNVFVPGLSERSYTEEQLEEWRNEEPTEYMGRSYTPYEAKQQMRKMESKMRIQRERIDALKKGNADISDIRVAQSKYRGQMQTYSDFSKAMGIQEQKQRIYMDGLGKQGFTGKFNFSGARITNLYSKEAQEHAKKYYKLIGSMKTDSAKISKNTGFAQREIEKVKQYAFINHAGISSDVFMYDFAMAQSWQRLIEGKDIQPHDLIMLEHEMFELTLKSVYPNITHESAHEWSQKLYNYKEGVDKFYGNT